MEDAYLVGNNFLYKLHANQRVTESVHGAEDNSASIEVLEGGTRWKEP